MAIFPGWKPEVPLYSLPADPDTSAGEGLDLHIAMHDNFDKVDTACSSEPNGF